MPCCVWAIFSSLIWVLLVRCNYWCFLHYVTIYEHFYLWDEHTNVNIHQPFITGVSRVCKSIPLSRSVSSEERCCSSLKHIHVDVVCTLNRKPVWIIVSDRNPEYISWDRCCKSKGLKLRIEEVLAAALSNLTLRPSSVILFFANGLATYIYNNLWDEFGASEIGLDFLVFSSDMLEETEGDWINVIARSYRNACLWNQPCWWQGCWGYKFWM